MGKPVTKILAFATLLLLLSLPSLAQNTKGDRPIQSRESRFRKVDAKQDAKKKKQKPKKQTIAKRKEFRPSKKVTGGDRAARPVTRLRNTDPDKSGRRPKAGSYKRVTDRSPSERSKNVYRNRRLYVHNNSQDAPRDDRQPANKNLFVRNPQQPPRDDRRPISNKKIKARVKAQSATQRPDNVFPQEGRFVNNPSKTPRDHPQGVSNRPAMARLKKLQGPDPRPRPKKRVVTRSASRSYIARKSINIVASYPRGKRKTEKPYMRDIAGRRLRTRNFESQKPAIVQTPSDRRYTFRSKRPRLADERPRYGGFSSAREKPRIARRRIFPRSISSSARKSYEPSGPSVYPRPVERTEKDAPGKRRLKQLQTKRQRQGRTGGAIIPRSASGGFLARKSPNTWAQFPRPKKKSERPYLRDIAGNKLRTRNYETPPRELIRPDYKPYFGRKRVGDRPYTAKTDGYASATRKRPRAWTGDIAGRKIRGKKTPRGDRASTIPSRGYRLSRPSPRVNEPLPARQPGIGATGIGKYRGERKARPARRNQGEGYAGNLRGVRRGFRDQGEQYSGSIKAKRKAYRDQGEESRGNLRGIRRGYTDQGEQYSGNIKAKRKAYRNQGEESRGNLRGIRRGYTDQGEQYSGSIKAKRKAYRNQGEEYRGNQKGFHGYLNQGEEFTGTLKTRRSPKGGGTASGKLWNNQGRAIAVRTPREKSSATFSGAIKARRPLTGGGSVSGKRWNNQGNPIPVRPPVETRAGAFQGSLKSARKPRLGAESISGKLWNNRGTAIAGRKPSKRAAAVAGFPGKIRRFTDQPGYSDQGEEYSGNLKGARRPFKGGGSASGKLWNNEGRPIVTRVPGGNYRQIGNYQGDLKTTRPQKGGGSVSGKLWNNRETPVAVRTPSDAAGKSGSFSGTIRLSRFRKDYVRNPNSSKQALAKQRPSKSVFEVGELQSRVKQQDYVRNNSSSKYAMKTREPGKAFGRSLDYQGNIKMQKFTLFERKRELHPDSKFVKANKNNVTEEKDALTNFKLWWARLFKKNDTQPDHLKEKNRRPRYDKGEEGLWYE